MLQRVGERYANLPHYGGVRIDVDQVRIEGVPPVDGNPSLYVEKNTAIELALHGLLLFCKHYGHLFQRYLVERASDFQPFGLLILLETRARVRIELAGLLARVKAALFEDRLDLFDLVSGGPKNRLPVCIRRIRSTVRVGGIWGLHPDRNRGREKDREHYGESFFHFFVLV